jgi:hypothetical protein
MTVTSGQALSSFAFHFFNYVNNSGKLVSLLTAILGKVGLQQFLHFTEISIGKTIVPNHTGLVITLTALEDYFVLKF